MFASTATLFKTAAQVLKTPARRNPMEWARENRVLPKGSSEQGRFRPERIPYFIPVAEAFINPKFKRIVIACGVQMAKTEFCIVCMGYVLDDAPVPILYVLPTQRLVETISPRVGEMLHSTPQLFDKLARGKRDKISEKYVGGVRLGFAWASSKNELSSHPAGVVFIDERDRMLNDVQGEGDPVQICEGRTATYPDAKIVIISTPTIEGSSQIWKLWEEGTQYRWNVPCPKCEQYFWPSLSKLKWEFDKSANKIKWARLVCPHCENEIEDRHRISMNAKGKYISENPEREESKTASFWVSGLCSPWRSYEQAASAFALANETKEIEKIQAVVNTVFGETWKISGEAPSFEQAKELRGELNLGDFPQQTQLVTASVDVQKDSLYYAVRSWGYRGESWTIDYGQIFGDTEKEEVWLDLEEQLLNEKWKVQGGYFQIGLMAVDSGYRSHMAYLFSKKHPNRVIATRGHESQTTPIRSSKIEVNHKGQHIPGGVNIFHFDDYYFKSLVHAKVKRGNYVGSEAWHLPNDVDDEYCKQVLSEQLVTKASGGKIWIQVYRDNHLLDCEKQNEVCGFILNTTKFRENDSSAKENAYKTLNKGLSE